MKKSNAELSLVFIPSQKLKSPFPPMYPLREVEHEDLYAAIDLAVDKLVGQMRKLKTRMERNNDRESFARNAISRRR